ncbi:MAG: Snf7 family protein [Promethearchaeota archaeon]
MVSQVSRTASIVMLIPALTSLIQDTYFTIAQALKLSPYHLQGKTMPLFKKKSGKIDKNQTFLDLKASIKQIDVSIKKKETTIVNLKKKAMVALANKREQLARNILAKKLKQEKSVGKLYNIQRKLSDQMDAIEEAETIQIATSALSSAVGVLKRYATIIEDLNVEEILADSEESMAVIEDAGEMIGDDTLDMLVDDEISEQLDALQAEVALEMGSQLALAPGDTEPVLVSQPLEPEPIHSDSEDVKKELEKLRKELDLS